MHHRRFDYLVERHKDRMKRADRRAGEIVAILYNLNRDPKEDPKGIDWTDVFAEWKEEPPEQTEDEMLETMFAFAASTEGLSH